jgi:hypothetical protein
MPETRLVNAQFEPTGTTCEYTRNTIFDGAGGLAGHIRFGARTGGALVILVALHQALRRGLVKL